MTINASAPRGLAVSALGLSLLLAGCGGGTDAASGPTSAATSAASGPSTSASPTPRAFRVGEQAACIEVFPHLQASADLVTKISETPDGSTVNQGTLDSTIDALDHVIEIAPADMVPALEEQVGPLKDLQSIFQTGQNKNLNFENFRSSGFDLVTRCGKYAKD